MEPDSQPTPVQQVLGFLDLLLAPTGALLRDYNRAPNYEDLYYLCAQLLDHESGNFENPAIVPFIQQLLPQVPQVLTTHPDARDMNLFHLAEESAHYIADVVATELSAPPQSLRHLNFIGDACKDPWFSDVDIYTLNHDLVLETYLRSKEVRFADGFGEPINGVRYWDPNAFETDSTKARLLKLHGSLDWYRLRPDGAGFDAEEIGIPLEGDPDHATARDGRRHWAVDGRPHILIGTFNKILGYTEGAFLDLLSELRRRLRRTKHLVVCGYGLADKGINTQIVEWIYGDRDRRLCIVHPDPTRLSMSARGAIRNKWGAWIQARRLVLVQRRAEDATFADIVTALEPLKGRADR